MSSKCPQDKIFNPATKRCVLKTGKIRQMLLQKNKGAEHLDVGIMEDFIKKYVIKCHKKFRRVDLRAYETQYYIEWDYIRIYIKRNEEKPAAVIECSIKKNSEFKLFGTVYKPEEHASLEAAFKNKKHYAWFLEILETINSIKEESLLGFEFDAEPSFYKELDKEAKMVRPLLNKWSAYIGKNVKR